MIVRAEADYSGHSPQIIWSEKQPWGHNPFFEGVQARLTSLWQETQETLRTNKGRVTKMLEILPPDLRIPQGVIPIQEEEKLKETVGKLIGEGKEVGLRTCFDAKMSPPAGSLPWIMGLNTQEQADVFFNKKTAETPSWQGSRETFADWLKRPGLEEIIVMGNPPDLGKTSLKEEHFVFRVEHQADALRIELRVGTNQLRDIEAGASSADLVEMTMKVPPSGYGIYSQGEIMVRVGENCLDRKSKKELRAQAKEEFNWKSDAKIQRVIKSLPRQIIDQVSETVFGKWCQDPSINFYHTLLALDQFDLGAIEFQGRFNREKILWMLAYGFRGLKEESLPLRPPTHTGD